MDEQTNKANKGNRASGISHLDNANRKDHGRGEPQKIMLEATAKS